MEEFPYPIRVWCSLIQSECDVPLSNHSVVRYVSIWGIVTCTQCWLLVEYVSKSCILHHQVLLHRILILCCYESTWFTKIAQVSQSEVGQNWKCGHITNFLLYPFLWDERDPRWSAHTVPRGAHTTTGRTHCTTGRTHCTTGRTHCTTGGNLPCHREHASTYYLPSANLCCRPDAVIG
jgi:hypothetical protein